jgi:putative isomerase
LSTKGAFGLERSESPAEIRNGRGRLDYLEILKDKIDLEAMPFSERSSRILLFKEKGADRFYIRIAERWPRQEIVLGHYRVRPAFIDQLTLVDESGAEVPFRLTTYPHKLTLDTTLGRLTIAFSDPETVYFKLPAARLGLRFRVLANQGRTDRRGGQLQGTRNFAYTTNGRIVSNRILRQDGGWYSVDLLVEGGEGAALTFNITPRLGFNRHLETDDVIERAADSWIDWFDLAPAVDPIYARQYYYAWWIMRVNLISSRYYLTREAMVPSKIHYVGVWHWDACFHALAYRHVDSKLAEDQLRLILDHQRPDGMIPDAVHDEGIVDSLTTPVAASVTKPPIIAWAALKIYESNGDIDFLDEIYEPLVKWNDWWLNCNDDDCDGIIQYNHPFSSGLDDSPLWDAGMPVESPDLNTYLYIQMDSLARIATILDDAESSAWRQRADSLVKKLIDHSYDEQTTVFRAFKLEHGYEHREIDVVTPFNLYPLWTAAIGEDIAAALVKHLTDPAEFWTPYPIPTVARNDKRYNPEQMWRGPVWVNVNYIFVEALEKNGYHDLARELADKTIDLVMRGKDIKEYYNPETGDEPPKAAPMYGWSAALFIDLLVKYHRAK